MLCIYNHTTDVEDDKYAIHNCIYGMYNHTTDVKDAIKHVF